MVFSAKWLVSELESLMEAKARADGRFEALRERLIRHAYRMLGDAGEAEDAVQEAFLRWNDATARHRIESDEAFLRTTVTRLAIDRLRSAQARREVYVGPWLPEPVVERAGDPEAAVVIADDISFALLLACERLSPHERAAFLLHDALDVPFDEIAQTLGVSVVAARQLASRGRKHVHQARPHRNVSPARAVALRDAFIAALQRDDATALQELMLEDVEFRADSGGKVPSAMAPVAGIARVSALLLGLARKGTAVVRRMEFAAINGMAGFILFDDGGVLQSVALDMRGDAIAAIYVTRNPEKLQRIAQRFRHSP